MTYPNIQFVDTAGNPLPLDEDGIPYLRQYKGQWYIKLDSFWSGGIALEGSSLYSLDWMPDRQLWKPSGTLGGDIIKRSGEITAVLTDLRGVVVENSPKANLRILPANITEQQMNNMINDIGIMALTTACCVHRNVLTPLGEGDGVENLGRQWFPGEGILSTATAILELANVVKNSWNDLEKRPLKTFTTEQGLVNLDRAPLSPHLLLQKLVNPSKRYIFGIRHTESTLCPENEFLCHVLEHYLHYLAKALADRLDVLIIEDISDEYIQNLTGKNDFRFKYFKEVKERIQKRNINREKLSHKMVSTSKSLRDCEEWAKKARQANFLKNVKTPLVPSLSSLRLTESATYGSIYREFCRTMGDISKSFQKVLNLVEKIHQGEVKPTWELYEIWCFAKLYSGMILYTTLKPDPNEPNFFESLSLDDDGSIILPKDKEFKLITNINGSTTTLEVNLTYEPNLTNIDGKNRKPDIKLTTKVGSDQEKIFFLDAKYRNYSEQEPERFTKDVIEIAREKYKKGLGANGSFILHSDSKATYDYWGEIPFDSFIKEKKINVKTSKEQEEYVGHTYGAISFAPETNDDKQLRKIIRLILQYNNLEVLGTVCLNCGYELSIGQDVQTSWKPDKISEEELVKRVLSGHGKSGQGTGIYCSCPKCGDFWVIQKCYHHGHRLLKFQDCFHHKSEHREYVDNWMYICPECGSDPSPEELGGKKASLQGKLSTMDMNLEEDLPF